jgi:anaphase-promoting complex subunit 4
MDPERRAFKLISENVVPHEVTLMEHSPRMDLIALGLATGGVCVYRLAWVRVWTLDAKDGCTPKALSWRPDGKALAVGWSDGVVTLHEIEYAKKYHEIELPAAVTCMNWMETSVKRFGVGLPFSYTDQTENLIRDLPLLPAEVGTDRPKDRWRSLQAKNIRKDKDSLDILLIGDANGYVHICLMGLLLIGSYLVPDDDDSDGDDSDGDNSVRSKLPVLSVSLSKCLGIFNTVVIKRDGKSSNGIVKFTQLISNLLPLKCQELHHFVSCFAHISAVLEYMSDVVKAMSDAWDSILLEIDSKLGGFAAKLPDDRSVQDEFLALLTCGTMSLELQSFLLNDLTEKGMKKMSQTVPSSYSAVLCLATTNLISACQLLIIRLGHLLGMTRWEDRFDQFGMSETTVEKCIHHVGSLSLKVEELANVIRTSMNDLNTFFQVLYCAIWRLENPDHEDADMGQLPQDRLLQVADFLLQLKPRAVAGSTAVCFNLEKVGQYLEDKDLSVLPETKPNCWTEFVKGKETSLVGDFIFQPHETKSLIQMVNSVYASVTAMFRDPIQVITESIYVAQSQPLWPIHEEFMMHTHNLASPGPSSDSDVTVAIEPTNRQRALVIRSTDQKKTPELSMLHILSYEKIISSKLYNVDTLALLLNSSNDPARTGNYSLAFISIKTLMSQGSLDLTQGLLDLSLSREISELIHQIRILPRTGFQALCVSGQRRVAAVLSASKKRIFLFDTEGEESESDDSDTESSDEDGS